MSKHIYRHTITGVEQELEDSFVALFPGAFEEVKPEPVKAPAKKTDSSKEGNN